jgi:ABC-2 type transport system permease protein
MQPTKRPTKRRLFRELNAVVTIAARDIAIALKSPFMLVSSLGLPVVMMGMLGGTLSQNMTAGLNFSYGPFMMVGMVVNMLFMNVTMSLNSLVDDHDSDFTQEMLIAPVSRYAIVIGKIFGSSFIAILSMFGVLLVGLFMGITLAWHQLLLLLLVSPLMCLAAGAVAMLLIGVIKSRQTANFATIFITMPQMFLSGALIPINNSSGVLLVLSRCLPMTYALDLMRAVVYAGTPQYTDVVLFNPAITLAAIVGLTLLFLIIGTYLFARKETSK